MPEWRYPLPLQPPPGSVEPEPTLDTAGWEAWAYHVARDEAATVPGAKTPPDFTVKLVVSVGPEIWFVRSGEEPGAWQDDHATVETRPPADYFDWRRFRRVYPRITYYVGREVWVELHIIAPPAAGTRIRYFHFTEIRSGPTVAHDVIQRRWVRTSKDRPAPGVTYREENWDGLNEIGRIPDNGDFPSTPTPRPSEIEERERQEAAEKEDPPSGGLKMKPDGSLELKGHYGMNERIWGYPGLSLEYARWRTAQEMRRRLGQNPKPPRRREMDYDGDADEATRADKKAHRG